MTKPLRLFVLAGEASGDRIGADLIRRLRSRVDVDLVGVGGPEMVAEGLASLYPISDLAVMGWSDVLKRTPLLLWRARQTAKAILRARPDVLVFIDAQVFSKVVAERVRRAGLRSPMLLYVAPTVWVWRPERAKVIKPLFDEVLAILPFEPAVMSELGGPPSSYVGHPTLSRFPMRPAQPDRGPLLLMPGSRTGELRRHLGLMKAAATGLAGHPKVSSFVIPTLDYLAPGLRTEVASWPVAVEVVSGTARDGLFETAVAAFAVTGTATLELAMSGVPTVSTYAADKGQAKHFGHLLGVQYVALPNIIAAREIVPELLFPSGPDLDRVMPALRALLDHPGAIATQRQGFAEIRSIMEKGAPGAPLQDPAERVLARAQRPLIGV